MHHAQTHRSLISTVELKYRLRIGFKFEATSNRNFKSSEIDLFFVFFRAKQEI